MGVRGLGLSRCVRVDELSEVAYAGAATGACAAMIGELAHGADSLASRRADVSVADPFAKADDHGVSVAAAGIRR